MSPTQLIILLVIGLFTGVMSALTGVGGGIVVIPLLTMVYGLEQKTAAATSLAMLLPPIGIFAVMQYHAKGLVDVRVAATLAVPFAVGALLGARYVMPRVDDRAVKIFFSALMLYAAILMLWRTQPRERAVFVAFLAAAAWTCGFFVLTLIGKRWQRRLQPPSAFYRPPSPATSTAIDFEI